MAKAKVDFDRFADNYDELLHQHTAFFSSSEAYFAKYKIDVLQREVDRPARRILEYGCGTGRNIPFIRAAFPDAFLAGSDISEASLEVAMESNAGIDFLLENGDAHAAENYDVIFIAGVFHHIPVNDRPGVVRELHRRLAPDGVMLIFEHNPYNPVTRKIVNDCPYDEDAVLLRPKELKGLLRDGGFGVVDAAYCLFFPPKLSALLPAERRLGWLPLGGQYWVKVKPQR